MKLYGVTSVYNEEDLVPIVMPYLERMGYDKLVVWDNGSTDRTVELLEQYPFIEIRHYDTEFFKETEKCTRIVNTVSEFAWLPKGENEAVWATICDFDEVFQFNVPPSSFLTFRDYLLLMSAKGYKQFREHQWLLMENGERVCYGEPFYWNKPNLFRVDGNTTLFLSVGQHDANIKYGDEEPKIAYDTKMLSALHLKYYNREIFLKRQQLRALRDYGIDSIGDNLEYNADVKKNLSEYDERLKLSIPYSEYFSHKILNGKEYVGRFLI